MTSNDSFENPYQALPAMPVTPIMELNPTKSFGGLFSNTYMRFKAPMILGRTSCMASGIETCLAGRG